MLLPNNNSTSLFSGGVLATEDIEMVVDGKLFGILSGALYKNKIGSPVREVSMNAVDSHTQAGKSDVPFVIHAPSQLEPWFSVKDTGMGLDEEGIKIFTTFNKSTKNNSNDLVGAFGFGSKSPLAYTDNFTVTAVKDGVRLVYSIAMKEDWTPARFKLAEEKTDEPNGVEVQMGVKSEDIAKFNSEIVEQLKYLKVKPIILNNSNIVFPDIMGNVIESYGDIHFRKYDYYNRTPVIVQGGVGYPLDLKIITENTTDEDFKRFLKDVIAPTQPIIYFDIGQIEVTPNREDISYTPATIDNIINKLFPVMKELRERLENTLDALPTTWDRILFLSKNKEFYYKIMDFTNNKWGIHSGNGQGGDLYIDAAPFFKTVEADTYKTALRATPYKLKYHRRANKVMEEEFRGRIHPTTGVVFVVDDGSSFLNLRIRNYIYTEHNKTAVAGLDKNIIVYLISNYRSEVLSIVTKTIADNNGLPATTEKVYSNWFKASMDQTALAELKVNLAGATFKLLSELPRPEKEVNDDGSVKEKYVAAKMYKFIGFSGYDGGFSHQDFEKVFVSAQKQEGGGVYVSIFGRSVNSGIAGYGSTFREMLGSKLWDLETKPIYALREADIAKIKDDPKWIPFSKAFTEFKEELATKYKSKLARITIREHAGRNLGWLLDDDFVNYVEANKVQFADPIINRYFARRATRSKYLLNPSDNNQDGIIKKLFPTEHEVLETKIEAKDEAIVRKIREKYPLLNMVHSGYGYAVHITNDVAKDMIEAIDYLYQKKGGLQKPPGCSIIISLTKEKQQ